MAKFVSDKSADRWNRTADIVSGGGAGNRFVRGPYRPPQGGGGSDTVIVIARATADVGAADASFTAKIKATIAGPPQTFDEEITVENLQPGDYLGPTVTGNYRPSNPPTAPNNDHVFVLLEGHNFIAVKANTDSVSWPSAYALKTGWFILQAPGTYVDCP
jgi:hypothetical protein